MSRWKMQPLGWLLKGIPWFIQATLSDEGFVSMEDLATRWDSPDRARETAPGELGFAPNNHHYTDVTSRLIAARMFQVVHAAQRSMGVGAHATAGPGPHTPGDTAPNLTVSCERGQLERVLGGEDQAHQTQAGPSRKRPAGEAPVQALRRRRDRFHPHEIPGKRTPRARRTAMEELFARAKQGRVVFAKGCRTWSILRHIPKARAHSRDTLGPSTPGPGRPDST